MTSLIRRVSLSVFFIFSGTLLALFLSDLLLSALGYPDRPAEILLARKPNQEFQFQDKEFSYSIRTNRDGMRFPNIPYSPAEGEKRVFVVGDSFVEGWGVSFQDSFVERLNSEFSSKNTRFLNGGIASHHALQYAQRFIKLGLKYNPDVLLFCLLANDLPVLDPRVSGADVHLSPSYERSQLRKSVHTALPHIYTLLSHFKHSSNRQKVSEVLKRRTGSYNSDFWIEALDIESNTALKRLQSLKSILAETFRVARKHRVKPILVYIPSDVQIDAARQVDLRERGYRVKSDWLLQPSRLERELSMFAEVQKLPFLNLTSLFRLEQNRAFQFYLPVDGHWNVDGHGLAAQGILAWLKTVHSLR